MKKSKNMPIAILKLTYILIIGFITTHTLLKPDASYNSANSLPKQEMTCFTFEKYNYDKDSPLQLTIFVHGIVSIQPYLSFNNFIRFMQDNIKDTYYEKSVSIMRENEFFYRNQAMGPIGLHYIDPYLPIDQNNSSALAMVYIFEQMQKLAHDPNIAHRYYMFGWSGLLSPRGRYEDAQKLFELLEQEVQRLKQYHNDIRIRIIGYSHGGNVALNLGAIHHDVYPNSSLSIDELILIGTPIQHDTDYMINDAMFKKIYNIYSCSDRVQKIDFFSWKRFLSGRTFTPYKSFTLPSKLTQIQIKVMRHRINRRSRKKHDTQSKILDPNQRGIASGRSSLLRNVSPGHAELWMFGWTPRFYRPTYPLYPLPTISILPFILKSVKEYHNLNRQSKSHQSNTNFINNNRSKHLIIDVRPEDEYILVKKQRTKKLKLIVPFVPTNILKDLQNKITTCAAKNYTRKEYEYNTRKAIKESKKIYQDLYASKTNKKCGRRCRVKAVAQMTPGSYMGPFGTHQKI